MDFKTTFNVNTVDGKSVNSTLKESLGFQCIVLSFISFHGLSGFNAVYPI